MSSPSSSVLSLLGFSSLFEFIQKRKQEVQQEGEQRRADNQRQIEAWQYLNENGVHPLKLLPKEIWRSIFGYLRDLEDLENTWKVCLLFRNLLEERRFTEVLFPLVLQVDTFRRLTFHYQHQGRRYPEGLLNIRLVNKSCLRAVDKYYSGRFENEGFGHRWVLPKILKFEPNDMVKLDKILSDFNPEDPQGARRFFSRTVEITLWNGTELTASFKRKIVRLLELIGSQLLGFRFRILSKPENIISFYRDLTQWANLMGNLKYLQLSLYWAEPEQPDEVEELRNFINENGFSHLPNLQKLTYSFPESPSIMDIFKGILLSNPQVAELDWGYYQGNNIIPHLSTEAVRNLPLETLRIHTYTTAMILVTPELLWNAWNLKKLNLILSARTQGEVGHVDVHGLFQHLQNFPTLQHLDLYLDPVGGDNVELLRLPNLEYFTVRYYGGASHLNLYHSIDYLLPAKRLKEIYWSWVWNANEPRVEGVYPQELVKFQASTENLYHSNIWDAFPFLERVKTSRFSAMPVEYKRSRRELYFDGVELTNFYVSRLFLGDND